MKTGMKIDGIDFLSKQMKAFGPTVSKKATKTGVGKAARRMARHVRNAAPSRTGRLKKQIGAKVGRNGIAWVGLRKPKSETNLLGYYKTLDLDHQRGRAYNPWFENAVESFSGEASDMIVRETTKALYAEATKVYKRSLQKNARSKGRG